MNDLEKRKLETPRKVLEQLPPPDGAVEFSITEEQIREGKRYDKDVELKLEGYKSESFIYKQPLKTGGEISLKLGKHGKLLAVKVRI